MSLFWRVFVTNALLIAAAALALALTPATISAPIALVEAVVLAVGLLLLLVANYVLLRRTFVPLERLSRGMRDVDLLRPRRRLPTSGGGQIGELVKSFNTMLEHLGLVSALKSLATTFAERTGLEIERQFAPNLPPLDPETEVALFRIAQEGLTNVARHAEATRVLMSLEHGRESIILRVIDDGQGMNGDSPSSGGGLRGMRERAVIIGAALAVKRAATGGVEVRLEVPAEAAEGR